MLTFYNFPVEHWAHIQTSKPIEPEFATVKLRTTWTKNVDSSITTPTVASKLIKTEHGNDGKYYGTKQRRVGTFNGVQFKGGVKVELNAALMTYTPNRRSTRLFSW